MVRPGPVRELERPHDILLWTLFFTHPRSWWDRAHGSSSEGCAKRNEWLSNAMKRIAGGYITELLLASRRSGSCCGYVFVSWLNLERMSDDDLVKHGNVQLSFCVDFSVFPLSTTVPQSFANNMSLNSTQQYLRHPVVPKPGLQAVRLVWLSCGVSSGTFLWRISTTWVPIVVLCTSTSHVKTL